MTDMELFRTTNKKTGLPDEPQPSGITNKGFRPDGTDSDKIDAHTGTKVDGENGHYANIDSENQRGDDDNRYHLPIDGVDDGREYNDDNDDDDTEDNGCARTVGAIQGAISQFVKQNSTLLKYVIGIAVIILYYYYFIRALLYEFGDEASWRLLVCTVFFSLLLAYKMFSNYRKMGKEEEDENVFKSSFWKDVTERLGHCIIKFRLVLFLQIALVAGFIVYLVLDVAIDKPRNLVSLAGIFFFVITSYIFSHNPAKIRWRPVFWGLSLQIIFALLILRTAWGREAFQWLGDRVTELLAYTDAGSKFVFGDLYTNHFFAFKVLPVVVFFSTVVAMLYYMGVMQAVIKQMGRFLSFSLGTSPTESINAAGNIFLGQTEAPLLIRPFLKDMTNSEIHAVMTGGFATIAGAVMAAYIQYDVSAHHLLSASVMSAPAALAMSKLFYPETKKSKHNAKDVYKLAKGDEINFIEAASSGASMSISLVANITVNLIAFTALLEFVNATFVWFGDRVGYDNFTFQLICSYVFYPLAYMMGVDEGDCRRVGELIGTKTFLNEFVAYVALSENIKNRLVLDEYLANATKNATNNLTGLWDHTSDGDIYLYDTNRTLTGTVLSDRSVVIATYALCGFSNFASMGVQLGGLGAMAPSRRGDMSKLVFRAMICGNVACFMTACISGLFYEQGE